MYKIACTSNLKTIVITEGNKKNYNFAIKNVDQNIIALDIFLRFIIVLKYVNYVNNIEGWRLTIQNEMQSLKSKIRIKYIKKKDQHRIFQTNEFMDLKGWK